jgi:hypothetical protein
MGQLIIKQPPTVSDDTEDELALKEDAANKNAASGYAPLDSGSKVPVANLPAASAVAAGTQSAAHFSAVAALGTMSTQAADAVAITGGTATGLTQLATTAACTALLGGAAASAQSSLAILASKTVAAPIAGTVWRGLDFQASTLTLTAGGTAPDLLAAVHIAAPVITQTAGAAYTVPACSTLYIAGPPAASAAGGATPTLTAAGVATLTVASGNSLLRGKVGIAGGATAPTHDLVVGPDVGNFTPSGTTLAVTSTSANASICWGQSVLNSVAFRWIFSGTPASAYAQLNTAGYNNAIMIDGSHLRLQSVNSTGNVLIGATSDLAGTKLQVLATKTIASASGAVWDGVKFAASTASITGATQITTASGFNFHAIEAPTINCNAGGLIIDHSYTVYIAGAPASGTNTPTLSDNGALWIAAGNVKIGSLAGSGTRAVVADANGVLSAP